MEAVKVQMLPSPIKSESDKKEYRVIKLENGLLATIVSDKTLLVNENEPQAETEQLGDVNQEALKNKVTDEKIAAAALYIGVGSFSDPVEVPGMSQFLEHMVCMGNEKYPKENDFDSFIRTNGGWYNTNTDYEGTGFYFGCLEKYLPQALDKFSQFFIAPLMNKEVLTREKEAVALEFQTSSTVDVIRKKRLLMRTAKVDSPVYRSLKPFNDNITDNELYEGVHEHRKRHYSAHRMTLAIQASLPIETLQTLVTECFSNIPNNKLPKFDFSEFTGTFETPEFNKIYYIKPVTEVIELSLIWSLPPLTYDYKSKPMKYLSNLLGDQGKGSILSYLKNHMWAITLSAGNWDNNSMCSLFNINIELSEEGFKHIFDVIETVFSYINLLKSIGPQKRIYDELKLVSDLNFKFKSEDSAIFVTSELASAMQVYAPEDLICGTQLYYEYNPDKITMVLNHFTPRKVNISITSKKLPDGLKFDKTEKCCGTEYTDIDIPEKLLTQWEQVVPYPELSIPLPNPYLPSNFTILPEIPNHPEYPQKLINTSKCELWYRQDQKFKLPVAHYSFLLINSISIESPKTVALLDMFVDLLSFTISEDAYPSCSAGLTNYFVNQGSGIAFEVFGFDEKLPVLIELIIKYIKNLCVYINENMFKELKEALLKTYYNRIISPFSLEGEVHSKLLIKNYWSPAETYSELLKLTFHDVEEFIKNYHNNLYIKALVQGNVLPIVACDTVNSLVNSLDFDEIPKGKYPKFIMSQVPIGEKCLLVESLNTNDSTCVTSNYYQVGPFTLEDSVLIDIIMRIIDEPFYRLRTNEQLGNDVYSGGCHRFGILGYSFTLYSQANKYTTEYLDSKIEEFLNQSQKLIEETSVDSLEKIKETLIKTTEWCDHYLQAEVHRNWSEITTEEYMFDRQRKEIETIKIINLDDVVMWWNKHNRFGNKKNFRKISIQVAGHIQDNKTTSSEETAENQTDIKDTTIKILGNNNNVPEGKDFDYFIEDIDEFKAELCAYPKKAEE